MNLYSAFFTDILIFLLIQFGLFLLFKKIANVHEEFILNRIFDSKLHFLIFNSCILFTCLILNIKKQLFCIPVVWTSSILFLSSLSFLLLPYIDQKTRGFSLITFFAGMGFFINLYIIVFGGWVYFVFLIANLMVFVFPLLRGIRKRGANKVFLFYPAFILTPYFFLFQLIAFVGFLNSKLHKIIFLSSSVILFIISIYFSSRMMEIFNRTNSKINMISEMKEIQKNPIDNYLLELLLGAHWKYHTELDVMYDGWRPPFHDPFIVICKRIYFNKTRFGAGNRIYYFDYSRPDSLRTERAYKIIYPRNNTEFTCRCGIDERLFSTYKSYLDPGKIYFQP